MILVSICIFIMFNIKNIKTSTSLSTSQRFEIELQNDDKIKIYLGASKIRKVIANIGQIEDFLENIEYFLIYVKELLLNENTKLKKKNNFDRWIKNTRKWISSHNPPGEKYILLSFIHFYDFISKTLDLFENFWFQEASVNKNLLDKIILIQILYEERIKPYLNLLIYRLSKENIFTNLLNRGYKQQCKEFIKEISCLCQNSDDIVLDSHDILGISRAFYNVFEKCEGIQVNDDFKIKIPKSSYPFRKNYGGPLYGLLCADFLLVQNIKSVSDEVFPKSKE